MDTSDLQEENANLKAQLAALQQERERERQEHEARAANERNALQHHAEAAQQKTSELEAIKQSMVRLTRQLDEEVAKRDQVQAEASMLERRMHDLAPQTRASAPAAPTPTGGRPHRGRGEEDDHEARERGSQVSTKLMRVVDQWMRQRDLQQALLRGASINDQAFSTLVQALNDCSSLQTLDLSQNLLTMDSCSDLCQLITTAPNLSFLSLADNLFSLRSIGYFMTAVMERQNTKRLMPLDLLDLQGNEGLVAAAAAPAPETLLKMVKSSLGAGQTRLPPNGAELVAQVMRALWRFLHDTGHPQIRDSSPDEIAFYAMDKITLRKMDGALTKIMLLGVDGAEQAGSRPVTANMALFGQLSGGGPLSPLAGDGGTEGSLGGEQQSSRQPSPTLAPKAFGGYPGGGGGGGATAISQDLPDVIPPSKMASRPMRQEVYDPFSDLKAAFEPPKEKLKTFNLKQIVTRTGTVLMNMLERLLETTEIDAHDVETEQTLLEYACNTGNIGLAKLCYRRGAKLAARTRRGDTAFNIVTRSRRYDMMEFLHTYGVKVNSADKDGKTALHCAAANNDVDGICRLVEWGADVNIRDNGQRTPIHLAAAAGNMQATMLLLEVGADMNAKDEKLYTAAAHANMNSHFALFDRLTALGGRRHGQIAAALARSASQKRVGDLAISAGMLKSSSLGRIGKISVAGMPGPLLPSLVVEKK